MNTSSIVQKLWNYCNVLRDDGMSYGDYVEQLTYLLFLKMADERTKAPYLLARAQIRRERICQDPAKLRRLVVDFIDHEGMVSIGRA